MQEQPARGEAYLRAVLDAFPSPVFVVDHEMRFQDANLAGARLVGGTPAAILRRPCGEALHCLHERPAPTGCGSGPFCRDCALRQAVHAAYSGAATYRRVHAMKVDSGGIESQAWFLVTAAPLRHAGHSFALLTLEDVGELVQLRRLVPMCANCRKLRDDANYWHDVETYLARYTGMEFTHGICPDCVRLLYPEVADKVLAGEPQPRC